MRADKASARVRTIFEEWPDVINVWHVLADWGLALGRRRSTNLAELHEIMRTTHRD
jgi:hypothetical protein